MEWAGLPPLSPPNTPPPGPSSSVAILCADPFRLRSRGSKSGKQMSQMPLKFGLVNHLCFLCFKEARLPHRLPPPPDGPSGGREGGFPPSHY